MKLSNTFHHYKGGSLSRSEQIERYVVDEIINSTISDDERDSSKAWELMHSSTCKTFMHVLAEKRGLNYELSRVAGAVHDFFVIRTGKYKNHAKEGVPLVAELLNRQGEFSGQEIQLVLDMVGHHSEKDIYSSDPYVELIKDADVFDCSLYPGTEAYYLAKKPFPVCFEYFSRMAVVRNELGLPPRVAFDTLTALSKGQQLELGELLECSDGTGPVPVFFALRSFLRTIPPELVSGIHIDHFGGSTAWKAFFRTPYEPKGNQDDFSIDSLIMATGKFVFNDDNYSSSTLQKLELDFSVAMDGLWSNCFDIVNLRESVALQFQDFECDPHSDAQLNSIVDDTIFQMITTLKSKDTWAQLMGQSLCSEVEKWKGKAWDVNDAQKGTIADLAKAILKARLRGLCVKALEHKLNLFRSLHPQEFEGILPKSLIAGEVHLCSNDMNSDWSLVSWPLFGSCEFLVGEEAAIRKTMISNYVGSQCCN